MDINTQNSSGMMNGMPPTAPTEKKVGPIVGVLIIVLILIIAGLYYFGKNLNTQPTAGQQKTPEEQVTPAVTNSQNSAVIAASATGADDVTSLEADLKGELSNIEYSF